MLQVLKNVKEEIIRVKINTYCANYKTTTKHSI